MPDGELTPAAQASSLACPACAQPIKVPDPIPQGRVDVQCRHCGQTIGLDNFPPAKLQGFRPLTPDPNQG